MKTLVVYDGTLNAKTALRYGLGKVKELGGELIVLHVFNSNLFIDYDAIPRAEEIARRESSRYLQEAEMIIREEGKGVKASIIETEGDREEEVLNLARPEQVDIIFSPPRYKSLVKKPPCPVSIIPGTIVVPIDNVDISAAQLEQVVKEAKALHAHVNLLGLVPIHICSESEKEGLKKVTKEISSTLRRLKQIPVGYGVETKEMVRYGYPDEEIVKVANEDTISMIIFLASGNRPSEVNKAVNIILDETDRLKMPILK